MYMYERCLDNECYLIVCSFSRLPVKPKKPEKFWGKHGELVISNYPQDKIAEKEGFTGHIQKEVEDFEYRHGYFRPYETRVYLYHF